MAGTVIRTARANDLTRLVELDTVAQSEEGRIRAIGRWVELGQCFCAEYDGLIAGYGVLHNYFFERPFLEMLMVDEALRGRGFGPALVAHAAHSCGASQLWTSTNASNLVMRRLLNRLGFTHAGTIYGLDEGDPELVFCVETDGFEHFPE